MVIDSMAIGLLISLARVIDQNSYMVFDELSYRYMVFDQCSWLIDQHSYMVIDQHSYMVIDQHSWLIDQHNHR